MKRPNYMFVQSIQLSAIVGMGNYILLNHEVVRMLIKCKWDKFGKYVAALFQCLPLWTTCFMSMFVHSKARQSDAFTFENLSSADLEGAHTARAPCSQNKLAPPGSVWYFILLAPSRSIFSVNRSVFDVVALISPASFNYKLFYLPLFGTIATQVWFQINASPEDTCGNIEACNIHNHNNTRLPLKCQTTCQWACSWLSVEVTSGAIWLVDV